MKYLEELSSGECFETKETHWFLTSDFKSNGKKLCYNLSNGYPRWMDGNTIVEVSPIYTLDKDNNILPIKAYINENNKLS